MDVNGTINQKRLRLSGIFALVLLSCLAVLGVFELAVSAITAPIGFIDGGKRWSSAGEPYAVISLYMEDDSALSADRVEYYAPAMDAALVSASVDSGERGRVWTYAYSAKAVKTVTGPRSSRAAAITACGGDFFVFHPLNFIHGSGFLNDPSNPYGVVLDEELAWEIFGAVDVVGMEMTIEALSLTVVGIVAAERESHPYAYTYGELPRMYMSYSAYDRINGERDDITVYEVTLPNPVKSFAMNIFNTVVSVNEDTTRLAEVSSRYSLSTRFSNVRELRYSWIREDKISYPYWENEARMVDHTCAVLMIFELIFVSVGTLAFLISLIFLVTSGVSPISAAKNLLGRISDAKAQRNRGKIRGKRRNRRKNVKIIPGKERTEL